MTSDDLVEKAYSSFVSYIAAGLCTDKDMMLKAYTELKGWIFTQRIVPGQKLIYKDLADKLGMSKTPIIYALTRLESEGFVERHLNRGYYVHEMHEKEVAELYDAREAIEIFSLEKSIGNLTESHIKELEKLARYYQEAEYTAIRKRAIIDGTFHLKITEASGSKYLPSLLIGLFSRLYLTYRLDRLSPQRMITAENEHSKILKAIKDKDTKAAKKHLQEHIRNGKKIIIESLQNDSTKSVST